VRQDRKKPNAAAPDIAHPACTMVHMANIAHRVGNVTLKYHAAKGKFTNNEDANNLIKRQYRKGYETPAVI
jgi:hypothetical protein